MGKSTNSWTRELPAEWENRSLPDLVSEIIDNRGRTAPTAGSGIPLIATNCIKNDGLYPTYEKVRFVSEETYKTWFRGHPKPGDIIFVNKGSPGSTCLVPDPVDFCIAQDMVALRPNREIVDGEYLLAALRSPDALAQVQAFNVGTIIPHLKKTDFPKLLLPLPPRPMQEFIGRLYCDLSRKIELNRRINQTLEAMAQALYKHWFVDFGPFRGGEFVDSELGEIPQDWHVGKLEELIFLQRGFDLPSQNQIPGQYPILTSSGFNGTHNEYRVKGPGVTTGRSGMLGNVFFVQEDFWPHNTSLWVKEFRSSRPHHAYFLLQNIKLSSFNAGSAVATLNRNDVHAFLTIVPPLRIVEEFEERVISLFHLIHSNEKESNALTRTRDYLLPKLLSGEVEVRVAKEQVEKTQ